jgi:hypothetical protein
VSCSVRGKIVGTLGGESSEAARPRALNWVERIPFAETRNYVQRVMENLQAYRARFDATATAPNVHPAESVQLRDKPTLVDSIPH